MLVKEDGRLSVPNAQHLAAQLHVNPERVYKLIKESDKPFRSNKRYIHADRLMGPILANDFTFELAVKQINLLAKDGKCWPEDIDACKKLIEYRLQRGVTWYKKFSAKEYQLPTGLIVKVKVAGLAGYKGGACLVAPLFWARKGMEDVALRFWLHVLKGTFCKYEMSEVDFDIVTMRRPLPTKLQKQGGVKPDRVLEVINSSCIEEMSDEEFVKLCRCYHQQLENYLSDTGQGSAGPIQDLDGGVVGSGYGFDF